MYVAIASQKFPASGSRSVGGFVQYLEKENRGKQPEDHELFFDQKNDAVHAPEVIDTIDQTHNYSLPKNAPRYYTLALSPSQPELAWIANNNNRLRCYTRETMKEYASVFDREFNGKPVSEADLRYFAKIEYCRGFKYRDPEVRENLPYLRKIKSLQKELDATRSDGARSVLEGQLQKIYQQIPHKSGDNIIEIGTPKKGLQTHVHIVVSRIDVSGKHSLSPACQNKRADYLLNGKPVRSGFNRDQFFHRAEQTFDRMFDYERHFTESYSGHKLLKKDPDQYFNRLHQLSPVEKRVAFRTIARNRTNTDLLNLSPVQVALALKKFKRKLDRGVEASAISY